MVIIRLKKLILKNLKDRRELSMGSESYTKITGLGQRENEINILESKISRVSFEIETRKSRIKDLEKEMDKLRNQWTEVSKETLKLSNDIYISPIFRRVLEPKGIISKKQELEMGFKEKIDNKLQKINYLGKEIREMIKELNRELVELNEQLLQFNSELLVCNERFKINKLEA